VVVYRHIDNKADPSIARDETTMRHSKPKFF